MMRMSLATLAVLALAFGVAAANPSGDNVVINEIYPNPPGTFDGAEFIELYNPTGSPIDISGWVLTGPEYGQGCYYEERWYFPSGASIPANGYVVVAKDVADGDGFYDEFGFYPDYELFDTAFQYDSDYDDATVPDLINNDADADTTYTEEIRMVGGDGYGVKCNGYSNKDVIYLYTDVTLATLVDLVEYMNPEECTSDPCDGDDGANDNAYPDIPFLGNTLGRNTTGVDTDNSIDDFTLQVPSPGAVNVMNSPPWIRTVRYSPIPPTQSQNTQVSAVVTDASGIDSVLVYYNPAGSGWSRVVSSAAPGDSVYTGSLPILPDGTQVEYYVRAVDSLGAGINYPAEGQLGPFQLSIGLTTIANVQTPLAGGDESTLLGKAVNVTGLVTCAKGDLSYSYFFIHEGTGQYKGVKVYAPGYEGEINEGDDVTVCGEVDEYYSETEIDAHFPEAVVINSKGRTGYGYTDITTADFDADDVPAGEPYEGQLIRYTGCTVTAEPDNYGQWYVEDSSAGGAMVDDTGFYRYEPEILDPITTLAGIGRYTYSQYKIDPRYESDIVGPPRIADIRYTPIPPVAGNVTVTAELWDDIAITSASLRYSTVSGGPYSTAPMSSSKGDVPYEVWSAEIGPYSSGTVIYYFVECTDGTTTKQKPDGYEYSLYVGLEDIYEVQYVANPSVQDSSSYANGPVNVQGFVTAEPGVYSDYYFTIQDGSGGWNGIKVYDRSGSLTFSRGDEIVACGEVQENYGETELAVHFAEACVLASSKATEPEKVSIESNVLQSKSTAEQYESVLVEIEDATVKDPDIGLGEWMITTATDADTCRVDDDADYSYMPVLDDNVYVVGTVAFAFGNYKMEPRGDRDIAVNPVGIDGDLPVAKFGLAQNAPNPFNPKTTIAFNLPQAAHVSLEIYNVAGRKVATLVDGEMPAGPHAVEWNGKTADGSRVASGVYFYRLESGEKRASKKMVLMK